MIDSKSLLNQAYRKRGRAGEIFPPSVEVTNLFLPEKIDYRVYVLLLQWEYNVWSAICPLRFA